jgi:hypothetical protein
MGGARASEGALRETEAVVLVARHSLVGSNTVDDRTHEE